MSNNLDHIEKATKEEMIGLANTNTKLTNGLSQEEIKKYGDELTNVVKVETILVFLGTRYWKTPVSDPFFTPTTSLNIYLGGGYSKNYWPLTNDEQAFELAKRFEMKVDFQLKKAVINNQYGLFTAESDKSVNAAIVECAVSAITTLLSQKITKIGDIKWNEHG